MGIAFMSKALYDIFAGKVISEFDKIGTALIMIGALFFVAVGFVEYRRRLKSSK